jgi:hypothetical protein
VENGETVEMTRVYSLAEVDAHNEYYYDIATGTVTMALATFSEVALVSVDENPWNGAIDIEWYNDTDTSFEIYNADQLAGLGKLVDEGNTFDGKTILLGFDINLGGEEGGHSFDPIGYGYETDGGQVFKGTLDGQGHTIRNLYQNGWALGLSYSTAGGGLFASVVDAEFKNLTLDNAYVVMECIDMGVLVGYAYGTCRFENIIVSNSVIANYNRYTGGVVGEVNGNHTFINVDVPASTTISSLWGSFDTPIGGIIGGKYGNATVYMERCDVAAELDVFNDVTSAYRWYSYRRAGMLIGNTEETRKVDGRTEAVASFLTTVDCTVQYGDWVNYTYCQFGAENYPFVRVQEGLFNDPCSNPRYGHPEGADGNKVSDPDHDFYPAHNDGEAHGLSVVFHQLYGGGQGCYGGNLHVEECLGVTELTGVTAQEKFEAAIAQGTTLTPGKAYTLSELFVALDLPEELQIQNLSVNVYVSPVEFENVGNISGTYSRNDTDWTKSTITLSGSGYATITINDYYYCTPTVLVVNVGKTNPSYDIPNGLNATYGDKLANVELPEGFAWQDATASVGNAGVNTFVAIYTPEDTDKYNTVEVNVTVTVAKADPSYDIPNGLNATYGDKLANVELPEGFAWQDASASVGNVGVNTFVAVFTPADAKNYNTVNVEVKVAVTGKKFESKFTGDFLYRVGNANAVGLDYLFKAADGAEIGTVGVTVKNISGTASGVYTNNATWTNGTIKFSGTGVVKVTITDNAYCIPTVLYLEVVDAKNITSAEGSNNAGNRVLLKNVTFSGTYLYYKNVTLYGNGFSVDITGADHSDLKDLNDNSSNKSAYCNIWMVDSRFDNVQIIGSVYPEVGMTADSNYGNAAIRATGECYITNSYISNCRVPLRAEGNITLVNTLVDGGRYANIELRSGKLTLDGVTTINTVRKGSNGTTDVIGFGIVIHDEAANNVAISVIGNGLKQYNWVGETEHKTILSGNTYLQNAYKLIFNASNSNTIYFDYNNDRYVSTGILCLSADVDTSVVTGLDDRYCQAVSGQDAWVLTYNNSKHTDWFNASITTETIAFHPVQGSVVPHYTGDAAQTIEFTKGETYQFDTSVLTADKFGQNLTISSVVMNGTTYAYGAKIPITEGGDYEIVYTVVDPYNYNADASAATTVTHTKTITVTAIAKDAEILAPKFTFIDQKGNIYEATTVKVGDKTYVMPNVTAADPTTNSMSDINIGSANISGTTVYFPITTGYTVRSGSNFNRYYPLFNGINITDYTVAGDTIGTTYTASGNHTSLVASSGTKFIIPANGGQTNCGDYVKTSGQAGNAAGNSSSGWQGAGYNTSYGGTYLKSGNTSASRGNDANGYERIVWVEYCFNAGNGDVYYYRIGYHCNKESAQSCVTGDTLVTLGDGSQKRIDQVGADELFLVWDFVKGEYTAMPASILMNHGYNLYTVIALNFSDGTTVKVIGDHGFFHVGGNEFVLLDETNAMNYIGESFLKQDGDGFTAVTLESVNIYEDYAEAWSIVTVEHYNSILDGMFTLPPAEIPESPNYLMPFVIGEDMKYDEAAMQADIEKFGLYTYEDFAEYMTYEQFTALNLSIWKVAVGKGYISYEDIVTLARIYLS